MLRRRVLLTVGTLGLCYLAMAAWLDRRGARVAPDERFDAIVVLGRTRLAAALHRRGLAPVVVFTGGVGTHPPSEASAAAAVARVLLGGRRALLEHDRVLRQALGAREAARSIDATRVLVVTDAYHAFRAERVFRRHFPSAVAVGSQGPRSVRVRGALREVTAVTAYALLRRL